ncbi:hypothetical protein BDN72DRAFT_888069 [Pluteus cervinus]|uniref:Uncharacterized protein n=1 Tax=Pluteus cervinus TaxID=181527 RepID=A0ACD3AXA8_9AGAR|nr:hypothetical protein BDN72DRAFT_888069 [Pluteus cervinus]
MTPPPTLTSLLNSLHTHLQNQTQLLPTLHAQLGLPPSAIEDDLKALERKLMVEVESSVNGRKKEVEQWMEKCEEVENACLQYTRALGGNTKATGSSLGELRKEQNLPKRFEMVSEFQEKLRQMYHTKLEHLATLTNRLNTLARTLGADYFARDVLDPSPAPGKSASDTNKDVTPERFLKLEKELVRGKAEVTKRLTQLSTTLIQIDWLYTELGMSPPALEDLSMSSSSLASSSTSSRPGSSSSSDPFAISTPTPACRGRPITPFLFRDETTTPESEYPRILARFMARLEEADDEALTEGQSVPFGLENVEPTPGLLRWTASLQSSLEDTKRRRESHIQAMYDQLEGLWRRLGVDDVAMDAFVDMHKGSTEETIREYEEELERMLELKRERMGAFIESAREEIVRLWDDLMVGDDERGDFAPFADDEHTEELLSIHEEEIRRLKEERRLKAPLLASIKKYFDICSEEKELAAAASDQTRLLGRGRDPGRLLREEKMRKRVQKEKPRLELDLLNSIPAWEQETGHPFLVNGESILKMLMEIVSAADQENKRRPARAGSVPPRSTTPVNSAQGYVPGTTKTGVVTPAVRPGSSGVSQSLPNKRQKLGDSTSSQRRTTPAGGGRAPLGTNKGGNGRQPSPGARNTRKPSSGNGSSLPRPTPIAMPVPRPGTQHHSLGHGRLPSTVSSAYVAGRSTSVVVSGGYGSSGSRYPSNSKSQLAVNPAGLAKKGSRARRESFRPRQSADGVELGRSTGIAGSRWPTVTEEDEND